MLANRGAQARPGVPVQRQPRSLLRMEICVFSVQKS